MDESLFRQMFQIDQRAYDMLSKTAELVGLAEYVISTRRQAGTTYTIHKCERGFRVDTSTGKDLLYGLYGSYPFDTLERATQFVWKYCRK